MAEIRKLNFLDAPKVKKLVSQIGCDYSDIVLKTLLGQFYSIIHTFLPVKYKTISETFIYLEENTIMGIISVQPTQGNPCKMNIIKLIFKQNDYEVGKQLVDFVIAKFGAKGATSFHVSVDQSHDELITLLLKGCGFRQCSYENLWKIENFNTTNENKLPFRYYQNSDAKAVSRLFNAELKSHFRPTLERDRNEYKEPLFAGFNNFYKNRYVLEERHKQRIIAYVSITTSDNVNFIIDMSVNEGYGLDYTEILNFAITEISIRKTNFYAFLKHRQYTKTANILEEYLHKNNFNCIQTQCVLVKDFYKPIKQESSPIQVFLFGENSLTTN